MVSHAVGTPQTGIPSQLRAGEEEAAAGGGPQEVGQWLTRGAGLVQPVWAAHAVPAPLMLPLPLHYGVVFGIVNIENKLKHKKNDRAVHINFFFWGIFP